MTYNFTGKTAIVTGASRGIGEAIARTLAHDGARVALIARSGDALRALAASLPNDPVVIEADFADNANWAQTAEAAIKHLGTVDFLVNNAGVVAQENMKKLTADGLDFVMNVNVRNLILFTHALTPALTASRGAVVNISSVSSFGGGIGQVAYATSKGAVNSFTRNAAMDLGRFGVRVNAIAPGVIDDGMWNTAFSSGVNRDATMAAMKDRLPLEGRWGSAQNIADAVAFLLSDKAAYVTGQTIRVDGGMIV